VSLTLVTFTRADLDTVEPWFTDSDTRRYLGGPDWPAAMLDAAERGVGQEFRGALQTGAHHYLGRVTDRPVGYIDCGVFDRCTVYAGEGVEGPIITETIDAVTGSIAFAVDPELRGRGFGRALIGALVKHSDLRSVELFEAGVEPDNGPSRRCLDAAGFKLHSAQRDFEGMLYYRLARVPQ
jgi:RimJ/RimL family protein N-acetyltransferase